LVNSTVTPSSKLPNLFYGNNSSSNENTKEVNHTCPDTSCRMWYCSTSIGRIYARFQYCFWTSVCILLPDIFAHQMLEKQATICVCGPHPMNTPHFMGHCRFEGLG
jgi:hypothetical protein